MIAEPRRLARNAPASAGERAGFRRVTTATASPITESLRPITDDDDARATAALIAAAKPSWRPRVSTQVDRAGSRYHRVYIGAGSSSYLYPAGGGRWRASGSVPVFWRAAIAEALGERFEHEKPRRVGAGGRA